MEEELGFRALEMSYERLNRDGLAKVLLLDVNMSVVDITSTNSYVGILQLD